MGLLGFDDLNRLYWDEQTAYHIMNMEHALDSWVDRDTGKAVCDSWEPTLDLADMSRLQNKLFEMDYQISKHMFAGPKFSRPTWCVDVFKGYKERPNGLCGATEGEALCKGALHAIGQSWSRPRQLIDIEWLIKERDGKRRIAAEEIG